MGAIAPTNTLTTSAIRPEYKGFVTMMPRFVNCRPIGNSAECCNSRDMSGALRTGQGNQSCETAQYPAEDYSASDESSGKQEEYLAVAKGD